MKLTDEQIIKALECCKNKDIDCEDCPVYDFCNSDTLRMISEVLDLINRQKAEIENLRQIVRVSDENQDELIKTISQRDAEIERLEEKSRIDDKLLNDRVQEAVTSVSKANQKYVDALEKAFNDKVAELKTAKSEAIKEFAEKFKEKAGSIVTSCQGYEIYETKQYQISAINFDNLVKEMVGDTDV